MITIEEKAEKLYQATFDISRRLGEALPEMLKNESRLWLIEFGRKLPPKTKDQGEKAVARDLNKLFTHVGEEFLSTIGSAHGISAIDAWTTFKNGEKKNLKWDKIDYQGSGMYAFHQASRNRRGRVNRGIKGSRSQDIWRAPYVVTDESFEKYAGRTKKRVGRMKSGLLPALRVVAPQQNVASWVKRHEVNAPGYTQFDLSPNSPTPFILIANTARGIGNYKQIAINAFNTRIRALGRRLRRVQAGIADDVSRGRRIGKINTVTN